jgi:hypothetical protein
VRVAARRKHVAAPKTNNNSSRMQHKSIRLLIDMPKLLVVGSSGSNLPALHSKIAQLTGNAARRHAFNRGVAVLDRMSCAADAQQRRTASPAAFAWANFSPRTTPAAQVRTCAARSG